MKIQEIFVSHLLYPIIALFFATITLLINKKNKVLSNKHVIILVLLSSLVLGLSGLTSILGLSFIPYGYIALQIIYFVVGFWFVNKLSDSFDTGSEFWDKFLVILTVLCIYALGSYFFSLVFNFVGDFDYGFWASTATYTLILPIIFKWTHISMLSIPSEIYKIWKYNPNYEDPNFTSETSEKITVVKLELSKKPDDQEYIKVTARAPHNFTFGDWFQMFIHDYNVKYHDSPISFQQENGEMYGWIFYITPSLIQGKRYIDFEKSISENQLIDLPVSVVCKRVDKIH